MLIGAIALLAETPPYATILGALIGATGAIAAGAFTSWWLLRLERIRIDENRDLERIRLDSSREDVISKELADAVQQLAIKMSAALHSMCWLTWLARVAPERVTKERLDLYDSELHKTLPEISGYSTTVAALDRGVYKKIQPFVTAVYGLDAFIGKAGLLSGEDHDEMIHKLVRADAAMVALELQLPELLGDVVSKRVTKPSVPAAVTEIIDLNLESADGA